MRAHIHIYIYTYVHILIHNALGWTITTEYVNIIECVYIYMCYIYIFIFIYACAFTPLVRVYPKWLINTKLMAKQHCWKVTCRPPLMSVRWFQKKGLKQKQSNMTHKNMSNIYEGSENISDVVRIFSSIHDAAPPILDPSPSRLWSRAAVLKTVKSHGGSKPRTCFMWKPIRSIDIHWYLISQSLRAAKPGFSHDFPMDFPVLNRFFPWLSHGFSNLNQLSHIESPLWANSVHQRPSSVEWPKRMARIPRHPRCRDGNADVWLGCLNME